MEGELRHMQSDMRALVEADLDAQQVLFCCHMCNTDDCTLWAGCLCVKSFDCQVCP